MTELNALKAELPDLRKALDDANSAVRTKQAEIAGLNTEMEGLVTSLTGLNVQITAREGEIVDLQGRVKPLLDQLNAVNKEISDAESRLSGLQTQLTGLDKQVTDAQTVLRGLEAKKGQNNTAITAQRATVTEPAEPAARRAEPDEGHRRHDHLGWLRLILIDLRGRAFRPCPAGTHPPSASTDNARESARSGCPDARGAIGQGLLLLQDRVMGAAEGHDHGPWTSRRCRQARATVR
jgi:prefoldin subunit 5